MMDAAILIAAGLAGAAALGAAIWAVRERKRARVIESRFRNLVEAVPEYAIFVLDTAGRVASWNVGAERITGYSEKEILGKHFRMFFIGEDVDAEKPEALLRQAESRGRLEQASWHLRKDGSRYWAEVAMSAVRDGKGKLAGFSKVIRDSTDRKKAADALAESMRELDRRVQERSAELLESNRMLRQEVDRRAQTESSLRQSEATARGMFDTAVDAIITIDERGRIASFNPAAQRLFGYTAQDVIGKNVSILMPQPYRREHDSYLERYHATGQKRIIGIGREVIAQKKDGSTFPIELAVGEQHVEGRVVYTGFIRDITERKRLEAQVLEIAEREQNRIGQDLHDSLGQLLTGISFLVKALEGKVSAGGNADEAELKKIGALMAQAVSQTRALSRGLQPLDDPAELPVALGHLAESVREVFGVECVLHLDENAPTLIADLLKATHVYRIAQEAVNNAIRHGKAKRIELTLRGTGPGADHVELVIADNGVGFGQQRGSGIGLRTMTYRVKTIGGEIDISPRREGGVVVACIIPTR